MGNFNRDSRSGSGGGGRDFGRREFRRPGLDRPQMYSATCANCGNQCEVPFRPTGSKPIFCNNCFDRNSSQGSGPRTSYGSGGGRDRDSNVRSSFSNDRPMYDAVCANCGNDCKIPFQPREGREVLCSNCFGEKNGENRLGSRNDSRRPEGSSLNSQVEMLSQKIDKIMVHLGIVDAKKEEKKTPTKVKVADQEEPNEQEAPVSEIITEVLEEIAVEEKAEKKKAAPKKKTTKKKE